MAKTPLGYKVIANNKYEGMIYNNEIFKPIEIGQKMDAYIKTIRKDHKLDLILQPIGKNNQNDSDTNTIFNFTDWVTPQRGVELMILYSI